MISSLLISTCMLCAFDLQTSNARSIDVAALPVNNVDLMQTTKDSTQLFRKRYRQDDSDTDAGVEGGDAAAAIANSEYLYGTYSNVGTILNGVVQGNIGNILVGGTNFIPPGQLRNNVNLLVQNALIPTVQRVFQDVGQTIQRTFNQTSTTPPPGELSNSPQSTTTSRSSGFNPLKAIQTRLQGLLPSFNFGGSNEGSNINNVENGGSSSNNNNNRYRFGLPISPVSE